MAKNKETKSEISETENKISEINNLILDAKEFVEELEAEIKYGGSSDKAKELISLYNEKFNVNRKGIARKIQQVIKVKHGLKIQVEEILMNI